MRCYLVEDLSGDDLARVEARLTELGLHGPMDGIYFLPVPADLLSPEQAAHAPECGPHILALEVLPDHAGLKLELLVRGRGRLRCSCVTYADAAQRAWAMDFLDTCIKELDIAV
jgi:hypothetical protein